MSTPGKGKKDKTEPWRFQGSGINFSAKLIGIQEVADARGDKMCQDAIQRLKVFVKSTKDHKQRILVNVSLAGIKIIDVKSARVIHVHPVHKISFISRDVTDGRAFGYIFGPGDGTHLFFAIKTEKAAEGLVLTLRDLFQVVFEMKKKEVEEAKKQKETENSKIAQPTQDTWELNHHQQPESPGKKTGVVLPQQQQQQQQEPIYDVPRSPKLTDHRATSSVQTAQTAQPPEPSVGNLLNLETELAFIQEGLNQIDSYEGTAMPPSSPGRWSDSSWGSIPSTPQTTLSQSGFNVSSAQSTTDPFIISTPPHSGRPAQQSVPIVAPPNESASSELYRARPRPSQVNLGSPHIIALAPPQQQPPNLTQQSAKPNTVSNWATFDNSTSDFNSGSQFGSGTAGGGTIGLTLEPDPFSKHPFFFGSSTPTSATTNTGPPKEEVNAMFSDSNSSLNSNPFGDSSVFASPSLVSAGGTTRGGSTIDNAFSSTPAQSTPVNDSHYVNYGQTSANNFDSMFQDKAQQPDVSSILQSNPEPFPMEPGEFGFSGSQPAPASHNTAGSDPFGTTVSQQDENIISGGRENATSSSIDPFDISSVLLPPQRGPFDTSALQPQVVDEPEPASTSPPSDDRNSRASSNSSNGRDLSLPSLPSPPEPPPPLPKQISLESQDEAPAVPPRPTIEVPRPGARKLQKSATVDLSDIPPPPPPRPGVSNTAKISSPALRRQATIDVPCPSPPTLPPRPPHHPAVNIAPMLPTESCPRIPTPTSSSKDSRSDSYHSPSPTTDPFAVSLPQSKAKTKTGTIISRPRPRPKSKTSSRKPPSVRSISESPFARNSPSNVSSRSHDSCASGNVGSDREQADDWSKSAVTSDWTIKPDQAWDRVVNGASVERTHTPNSISSDNSGSLPVDPFANVDPFAADPSSEPPDPFTMDSPTSDPFANDFTKKARTFSTRAVTVDTDPFSDDPFDDYPFPPSDFADTYNTNQNNVLTRDNPNVSFKNNDDINTDRPRLRPSSNTCDSKDGSNLSQAKNNNNNAQEVSVLSDLDTLFKNQFHLPSKGCPNEGQGNSNHRKCVRDSWDLRDPTVNPGETSSEHSSNLNETFNQSHHGFMESNSGTSDSVSPSANQVLANHRDVDSVSSSSELSEAFANETAFAAPPSLGNSHVSSGKTANSSAIDDLLTLDWPASASEDYIYATVNK